MPTILQLHETMARAMVQLVRRHRASFPDHSQQLHTVNTAVIKFQNH